MRVLLDTNIVLDYLLEREPFVGDADALIQTIRTGQIQGYVTATTLTNIFYIARKAKGVEMARQNVSDIRAILMNTHALTINQKLHVLILLIPLGMSRITYVCIT